MQQDLFVHRPTRPKRGQLLKWIGNKHRYAVEIATHFPDRFGCYHEPFLGAGALLATLTPKRARASDVFKPLMEIWSALRDSPEDLKEWYRSRWQAMEDGEKVEAYETVKASYNAAPNGADLVFLSRSCYGGVVRFRKRDGFMSTPCGAHKPISPEKFALRVDEWCQRVSGTRFETLDFSDALAGAESGDLVYCDPPYSDTQKILYGAQDFSLERLCDAIADCKRRGVYVALSIDGKKRSGAKDCNVELPEGLFEREALINCGRSMLRRFQLGGQTLEGEVVADRLLLTY